MKKIISMALMAITAFVITVSISSCCKEEEQKVQGISISQTTLSLTPGSTPVAITATVLPSSATNPQILWTSSDESVATVDQAGKVTSVAAGTATITATAADGSGVKAECTVTVGPGSSSGTGITPGGTTEDPGFGSVDAKPSNVHIGM